MPITALYAGLLVPIFIVLAFRVIGVRRAARISVGDGGDKSLARRMRVHANFAEYVPMALLLMALLESVRPGARMLHVLGAVLVAGRIAHAIGMSRTPDYRPLRVAGVLATMFVLAGGALACLHAAAERGVGL